MIPPFTEAGLLPPGLHRATWDEVVDRFGTTPRRRRLLAGLREGATSLRDAGARWLWLDGGFVTAKSDPDDFDAAWDWTTVDLRKVDRILIDQRDLQAGRLKQKAKYLGEFLTGREGQSGMPYELYFQQDQDGNTKGIVLLDLRTLP